MRKLFAMLTLLALLGCAVCGCTGSPSRPGSADATKAPEGASETEAPATDVPVTEVPPTDVPATEVPPTEDPMEALVASLLPDWEVYSSSDAFSYSYRGVPREAFESYVEECKAKGFEYIREYDDSNSGALLLRDDLWIELSDNTHNCDEYNPSSCGLYFRFGKNDGGLTEAEALAVAGDGGTGKAPAAAIDLSPDGLYRNTGAQIFRVLYDLRPDRHPYSGKNYVMRYFLIAGSEAVRLSDDNYVYYATVYGDVDGDGVCEVIPFTVAPFGSVFYFIFGVYHTSGDKPEPIESGVIELDPHGRMQFISKDGKAYYSYAPKLADGDHAYGDPKEYEIVLRDGVLSVVDPEGEVLFRYNGPNIFELGVIEWPTPTP